MKAGEFLRRIVCMIALTACFVVALLLTGCESARESQFLAEAKTFQLHGAWFEFDDDFTKP